MDALRRHDAVFSRLLFDRSLREQARAGDWTAVADVADTFSHIDMGELEKLAVAIRDGLIRGNLGGLGIGPAFADTIAALDGGVEEVAERFLKATGGMTMYGRPMDGTGRRAGVSVVENFYGWAARELAQRPAALCQAQHELASALLTTLARTPRPGFFIGWPLVRPGLRGWYCILDAVRPLDGPQDRPESPIVYVAVGGRYATGRLSITLAAVVLECADDPPAWAPEQLAQCDSATLDATRRALAARGLL